MVAQGTSTSQQVVVGTVGDIANRIKQSSMESPALLIMGEVVSANGYAQWLATGVLEDLSSVS